MEVKKEKISKIPRIPIDIVGKYALMGKLGTCAAQRGIISRRTGKGFREKRECRVKTRGTETMAPNIQPVFSAVGFAFCSFGLAGFLCAVLSLFDCLC